MKYKPSVIRTSVESNDLLALVLDLKDMRDEALSIVDKLNKDIGLLEPILKEKMERGKR